MTYHIGDILHGRVTGIQHYGVFVSLDEQTQGLIHISECTHDYVADLHQLVHLGDRVRVVVLDIDAYTQKVSLSMRALEPVALGNHRRRPYFWTNYREQLGYQTIAHAMPGWLKAAQKDFT